MKRVTRAQLRGKPLDADRKRWGKPDPYQFGRKDKRCFCTGMLDRMTDDFVDKCRECAAWSPLATPIEVEEGE